MTDENRSLPAFPLGPDEPSLEELYQMGVITYQWALMEAVLDFIHLAILRLIPGADAIESDLPKTTSEKVTFFRRTHNELPLLSPLKESAISISTEINRLKEHRQDFVHGYAIVRADGLIKIQRLHLSGDSLTPLIRPYSSAKRWRITRAIAKCAKSVVKHSDDLVVLLETANKRD